jgi:hypothetical protein
MDHRVTTVSVRRLVSLVGICISCMGAPPAVAEPEDPPYLIYERLHPKASYAIIYNHLGVKLQVEELQDVRWEIIQSLKPDTDEACTPPKIACTIDGVQYCRRTC